MTPDSPEINYLLRCTERKYGRAIQTSSDFDLLSQKIEEKTGNLLSASTLKRLWGYVSMCPTPRLATLNILSRFIGFEDYTAFCKDYQDYSDENQSTFFSGTIISSKAIEKGQKIMIGWKPDRVITLEYLGNEQFIVLSSENSQLKPDDRFSVEAFVETYPLFISKILRNGKETAPYVAGATDGLTIVKKI